MICKKCGKEVNENNKYCNFCGTSTEGEISSQNVSCNTKNDIIKKINNFFIPLGKEKNLFISLTVLLALNPILSLFKVLKFTEGYTGNNIYSIKKSIFDMLSEFAEELRFIRVLTFIGVLSIIIAEFLLFLPLIKKVNYHTKYLKLTKIISILAILFIGFLTSLVFIDSGNYIKSSLTFWGWLLNIETIALVFTTYKFSSKIKKRNKNGESEKE